MQFGRQNITFNGPIYVWSVVPGQV